jgi:hypothetical protein
MAEIDYRARVAALLARRTDLRAEDVAALLAQATVPVEDRHVPAPVLARRAWGLAHGPLRAVDWRRLCELLEAWPQRPGA